MVYERLGRYPEAIDDYSTALQLGSNDAKLYYNRGTVYEKIKRNDAAIQDYKRYLGLKPDTGKGEEIRQRIVRLRKYTRPQ